MTTTEPTMSGPELEALIGRSEINDLEAILSVVSPSDGEPEHHVPSTFDTLFTWNYERSHAPMSRLYEKAKNSQWNGATDFVFCARRGEMASNRREDHEVSMLALHLIQNCMVYINTLMIQKVLAQPHWQGRFTPRDYAALTPLIWEHVNPYGRFDLDMNTRLDLP